MKVRPLAFLGILIMAGNTAVAQDDAAGHRINLADHPDVHAVSINVRNSDLSIRGSEDSSAIILKGEATEMKKSPEDKAKAHPGMRSLLPLSEDNTGLGFNTHVAGGKLIIEQSDYDGNDLEVTLPAGFNLEVQGVSSDMEIEGVTGSVSIRCVDGDVSFSGSRAPFSAESVSGDLMIRVDDLGADASTIHSVDGDVMVIVRPDQALNLEVMTVNGDIVSDMPVEIRDSNSMAGRRTLTGVLNGGGTLVKIASVEGDVAIKAAE